MSEEKLLSEMKALKSELESLSAEKSKLLSIVSHDIKSPFNRIFALVNLMKMDTDNLTDEQKEYLSKIQQVVKDGMSLIRNMLDMRSIEGDGITMKWEDVDVVQTLKGVLKNTKAIAELKNINLKFSAKQDSITVHTDKHYLTRIIENLLSNALKFSQTDMSIGIRIFLEDEMACIAVVDEGPGIPLEEQKQMYQKYMSLSSKPTDGESTTGLGLYIVKALSDKIKGEISCESIVGKGTTFSVRLPLTN